MKKENSQLTISAYVLVALLIAMLGFNQYLIQSINSGINSGALTNAATQTGNTISFADAAKEIMPTGIPAVYGSELGVSYDKTVESLAILGNLDGDLFADGKLNFTQLTDPQKIRYVKIGSMIACEFCCGASTLVFENGQPSCGCEHSAAMRGLAKYLLIYHDGEYTDQQILDELTKWKILFFPKQMVTKYMQANGLSVSGSSLPDMVGGC